MPDPIERYIHGDAVQELIGHEAILSPTDVTHMTIPIGVDSVWLHGRQGIDVSFARPISDPEFVILAPAAFTDNTHRDFQEKRLGAMAAYTNATVVGFNMPGMGNVGDAPAGYTENQVLQMQHGRMTDLATRWWQALGTMNYLTSRPDGSLRPISLVGNSLAALGVAEMAATAPEGVKIQDIHMSESMALQTTLKRTLAKKFIFRAGKHINEYLAMNQGFPVESSGSILGLAAQVARQGRAHWLPVVGLSAGKQLDALFDARERGAIDLDPEHGTRIHHVWGSEGITSEAGNNNLTTTVKVWREKLLRKQILQGEGHGYQDSIPALLDQLGYLTLVAAKRR